MLIAFTQSADHLSRYCTLPCLVHSLTQFSDGELKLHIQQNIRDEVVWIIAATHSPLKNLFELFLIIDLCTRAQVREINIFFSYFGYARDSALYEHASSGAHTIAQMLSGFSINTIHTLHAHAAHQLHNLLPHQNHIPYDFFRAAAHNVDIIVAPDEGAQTVAHTVAHHTKKESLFLKKLRTQTNEISIEPPLIDLRGKHALIVDDIIATGQTMTQAISAIKKAGAQSIQIAATHGLCSDHVYQQLAHLCKSLQVSNSIYHTEHIYFKEYNVWPFIEKTIRCF